jgi:dipeptidyl aminopeptidase/acylaminoacyl peptidase
MPDARVVAAIHHWAPRFVSNGVPLTDFQEVTAAWVKRAAVHEALGDAVFAQGLQLSAGEHWTRAAVCYHFAKFVFVEDVVQMKAAHLKAVDCRNKALPYLQPAGERVSIPFEGTQFRGILRKPAGVEKPPIVIMCMGLDSAKEETDAYEQPFLARGMAILAFDGPGQGESEYELGIRGDYEVAVRAVVDWVEKRDDVDRTRIGLWGVSMGGYYAPRAAAFEKRIQACISLSGPFEWAAHWDTMNELTRETFRVRAQQKTLDDARRFAATLSLANCAQQITCPLFIVAGKLDRIVPWTDGERLAKAAKGPVEFLLLDDGNHVANNRGYRWRSQSADWMARRLSVKQA